MGDLSAWAPRSNGFPGAQSRRGASFSSSSSSQQQPNPHPSVISAESWREAEKITQQIIQCIQPTVASEERRMAIISYVQRLIKGYLGSEVFPFGSVPLKTYLPDGDIDLTALCSPKTVDALACNLCSVLQLEEQNKDAEFEVKDVQYICAEVKLVKCLIQNIVVDISFNQLGGLCTICFLEQVDHLIQKDHLFKRSIILIKAWCYYESRILGAHHGLISTYALETLVLYIFHLFHSSLDGPLAVLYKFLDYFSKFDWDNYCISLRGPVSLSSLPELVAETPEADGGNLLLSKKFLDNCVKHFSASTMGLEGTRRFPLKHLNIVDLLKENNNLGRSVSRGNFYRIRSAFAYGARNLGQILLSPQEYIADEIRLFFTNTIERHGNGDRLDIQDSFPSSENGIMSDHNGCVNASSSDSYGALHEEISSIKILNLDREHWPSLQSRKCPSNQHQKANTPHKYSYTESCSYMEENVVSSRILAGDAGDRATNPTIISKTMGETCKSSLTGGEASALSSREAYYAPYFFCNPENGTVSGLYEQIHPVHVGTTQGKSSIQPSGCEEDRLLLSPGFYEAESSSNATYWLSTSQGMSAINEGGDTSLSDLQGNYHLHYRSLLYARWCQEYLFGGLVHPVHPSSPSYIHRTSSSDELQKKNGFSHVTENGPVHGLSFVPSPICYSTKQPLDSDANVTEDMQKLNEDIHKPHGTRTYFSGMNYRSYREKQPPVTERNLPAIEAPATPIHGGEGTTLTDMNLPKKEIPEASPSPQPPVCSGNDCGKPNLLDNVPEPLRPAIKESSHANGSVPEPKSAFPSFASVALGISSKWISKRSDPANSHSQCSTQVPSSAMWKPGTSSNNERTARPFQLKDDNDFPPLSGRKYDSNFPPLTRSPRRG